MEKLFDFIQNLPKGVQILLVIVVFVLLGFGVIKFAFGDKLKSGDTEPSNTESVVLDFPDGNEDVNNMSKLDELKSSETIRRGRANDYWESLTEEGVSSSDDQPVAEGGLMPEGGSSNGRNGEFYHKGQYLDPTVYSEMERYYIKKGVQTKEEIDAQHAKLEAVQKENEAREKEKEKENASKSVDADSLYFARMERAYQIAAKYSAEPDRAAEAVVKDEVEQSDKPEEPEPRKIDIEAKSAIPSTSLVEDQIICSLDAPSSPSDSGGASDEFGLSPAKATFLKTETLVTGQRVVMRLMQDLLLSDGTVIPTNTHISGICKIGSRLKIEISTINYGGRIYYANLDIYDNDGTEGIYCPTIVQEKGSKAAKNVAKRAGQSAASLVGNILSSSPYVNAAARAGMSSVVQMIDDQGNSAVAVSSGYEFYIFEDLKRNKNK